jgi:hypothetical protein
MTAANDHAVRHALEAAGAVFIDENGIGPGVSLTEVRKDKSKYAKLPNYERLRFQNEPISFPRTVDSRPSP